jgi:hypothetical protein
MCCGTECAGMVFKSHHLIDHVPALVQAVNYRAKDTLGCECENCGAYDCMDLECRKILNWSRRAGWNNVQRKECGQVIRPTRVLLPEETGVYLN